MSAEAEESPRKEQRRNVTVTGRCTVVAAMQLCSKPTSVRGRSGAAMRSKRQGDGIGGIKD
jgi:hypothetical protein